jgi:hypothetical protein
VALQPQWEVCNVTFTSYAGPDGRLVVSFAPIAEAALPAHAPYGPYTSEISQPISLSPTQQRVRGPVPAQLSTIIKTGSRGPEAVDLRAICRVKCSQDHQGVHVASSAVGVEMEKCSRRQKGSVHGSFIDLHASDNVASVRVASPSGHAANCDRGLNGPLSLASHKAHFLARGFESDGVESEAALRRSMHADQGLCSFSLKSGARLEASSTRDKGGCAVSAAACTQSVLDRIQDIAGSSACPVAWTETGMDRNEEIVEFTEDGGAFAQQEMRVRSGCGVHRQAAQARWLSTQVSEEPTSERLAEASSKTARPQSMIKRIGFVSLRSGCEDGPSSALHDDEDKCIPQACVAPAHSEQAATLNAGRWVQPVLQKGSNAASRVAVSRRAGTNAGPHALTDGPSRRAGTNALTDGPRADQGGSSARLKHMPEKTGHEDVQCSSQADKNVKASRDSVRGKGHRSLIERIDKSEPGTVLELQQRRVSCSAGSGTARATATGGTRTPDLSGENLAEYALVTPEPSPRGPGVEDVARRCLHSSNGVRHISNMLLPRGHASERLSKRSRNIAQLEGMNCRRKTVQDLPIIVAGSRGNEELFPTSPWIHEASASGQRIQDLDGAVHHNNNGSDVRVRTLLSLEPPTGLSCMQMCLEVEDNMKDHYSV